MKVCTARVSALTCTERVLLAALVVVALGANVAFLVYNLGRMRDAVAAPAQSIVVRELDAFPPFVLVLELDRALPYNVSCGEGYVPFMPNSSGEGEWARAPCAVQLRQSSLAKREWFYTVTPNITFANWAHVGATQQFALLALNVTMPPDSCVQIAAMRAADVQRFLTEFWLPDAFLSLCRGDDDDDTRRRQQSVRGTLEVSEMRYAAALGTPDTQHFALRSRQSRSPHLFELRTDSFSFRAQIISSAPAFTLIDLFSYGAAIFNLSLAVIAFFFPYRALARHSHQSCCRKVEVDARQQRRLQQHLDWAAAQRARGAGAGVGAGGADDDAGGEDGDHSDAPRAPSAGDRHQRLLNPS